MAQLFFLYLRALFVYLFSSAQVNDARHFAMTRLFAQPSFRFPEKARKDPFIVLRVAKRIFSGQFKNIKTHRYNNQNGHAIFDSDLRSVDLRTGYVERLSGQKVQVVFARSELVKFISPGLTLVVCLCLATLVPPLFVLSMFLRDRLKAAIWLTNLVEAFALFTLLKKEKCSSLWFFNIYENDANLLAYGLMQSGVTVNKISSEVPLQFWNSVVVADTLCLCFRYQEDEFKEYQSTMFVNETLHWIPETALQLETYYRNNMQTPVSGTLGFYSSGMWMRKQNGDVDLKDNPLKNEQDLLRFLLDFVKQATQTKLVVFLHPLEKKDLTKTREYYDSLGENIHFANLSIPNDQQFYEADVAVSLYSTMAFNRIFWGFKTLIFPAGQENFPIEGSVFANVCTRNWDLLKNKLQTALESDTDDFFKQNGIGNYTYRAYPVTSSS